MPELATYWTNERSDAYPLELTVSQGGEAVLKVTSNSGCPERWPVGVFADRIEPETVRSLWKLLQDPALAAMEAPAGMTPGEIIRSVSLVAEDGSPVLEKAVGESMTPPPAFEAVENLTRKLIEGLSQSGRQALSVGIESCPEQVATEDRVSITLEVSNRGSSPLRVPAPREWATTGVSALLTIRRSDVPLEDLRDHHQVFVELSGADVETVTPAFADASTFRLDVGQSMFLAFRPRIAIEPGSYDVRATLLTPLLDTDGEEVVACEAESEPVTLRCLSGRP